MVEGVDTVVIIGSDVVEVVVEVVVDVVKVETLEVNVDDVDDAGADDDDDDDDVTPANTALTSGSVERMPSVRSAAGQPPC